MIQIIGLDLDGTLLNDQKAICDRNIEVLMRAKEEGAKIVLCSGRAPEGMQRELKILGLKEKGQYAVGLNGAVVYEADTGEVIHQTLMQPEAVRTMVETGRRFRDRMNIQLYTGGQVYVERWDETTDYYEKATGSHAKDHRAGTFRPSGGVVVQKHGQRTSKKGTSCHTGRGLCGRM